MSTPGPPVGALPPRHTTLHRLQQLLPTCQRCRRLRRKCDTQLPNCRPCHRAGVECTIFDHALKQTLPRAYVQSLLTRVEHLEAVKASGGRADTARLSSNTASNMANNMAAVTTPSSATTLAPPQSSPVATSSHSPSDPIPDDGVFTDTPSYDVVVPSTTSAGKSRYWGASSVFALTVEILQHATARGYVSQEDVLEGNGALPPDTDLDEQAPYNAYYNPHAQSSAGGDAAEADIRALLRLYLASSNTLYGVVDPDQASADLEIYLAVRHQRASTPAAAGTTPPAAAAASPGALGDQAHPYFRVAMMCAIACATRARYRPQRTAESLAYYADAVAYVEEVTAEVSPASLQALLLLIVFCLFFPRKGDVWKLLDYACRLALELGYHTEGEQGTQQGSDYAVPEMDTAADVNMASGAAEASASEAQKKLRRSTFWGLYAIERIVGQLFGRGSDLPESIITVAYPSAMDATPGVDRATLQTMSIAHHYRLVYLRSEIFRSLYLPARPPVLGQLDWLRQQYQTLFAWRQELAVPEGDQREGVATVTCDVGYDATMCFLFQPLLLRALRETAAEPGSTLGVEESASGVPTTPVASDPFYSSIRLIRTYEKIIRAPEASALGSYPMTFMSAHYIYLASSTLLAHALLRLDGRTKTLRRMSEDTVLSPASDTEEAELDWGAYVDVSSSCLILLAWCGERWPGMLGMLGVYQRLFGRTIRELIGKGIVR